MGQDALKLPDGSRRALLECRTSWRGAEAGLARTLILTRLADGLAAGDLEALAVEHDLSFHARPGRQAGLVEVGGLLTLWAATRGELDAATERAEMLLGTLGARARRPYLQAEPALVTALPLCLDLLSVGRARLRGPHRSESAERRVPVLYGVDPGSRAPQLLDRFS